MVHSFKFGGRRFAFDSVSGSLHVLDEIAYKMLDYIELPMPKDCPSALRYDLAKYDSAAISDTYDMLYKLYLEGKLYSEDTDFTPTEAEEKCGGIALCFADGTIVSHSKPHILSHALEICDSGEIGLKIICGADDELTDEDLPSVLKEIEKLNKELNKRGSDVLIFAPVDTFEHTFAVCKGCFARRLCSLKCPSSVACELERKRVECVLSQSAK
jgi:hypothetical protein